MPGLVLLLGMPGIGWNENPVGKITGLKSNYDVYAELT
jgi:hypothetical protein